MARLWIARIMLLYSMLTALLLALALPLPDHATAVQRWNLAILLAVFGACLASFVWLRRRPLAGWRIAGALGILGAVLLGLNVRTILLIAHGGWTAPLLSAAILLSLWCALIIAGACSLGRLGQRPVLSPASSSSPSPESALPE